LYVNLCRIPSSPKGFSFHFVCKFVPHPPLGILCRGRALQEFPRAPALLLVWGRAVERLTLQARLACLLVDRVHDDVSSLEALHRFLFLALRALHFVCFRAPLTFGGSAGRVFSGVSRQCAEPRGYVACTATKCGVITNCTFARATAVFARLDERGDDGGVACYV